MQMFFAIFIKASHVFFMMHAVVHILQFDKA